MDSFPQATIAPLLESKSVRLDVLAKDKQGNHYNVEMQVVNNDSISKRLRIYQASIDLTFFKKGMRYKDAKDTIIIFICMTSPIKKGLPIYTFKNLCEEDPHIALEDGTLKVILCPREWRKVQDAKIRAVLKYIYDGIPVDNYTKELDMCVTDIKYDEVISNESLSYFFKMQDAREEGREEGICETARNMRAKSFDISLISEVTGLTIEEIEKL